MTESGNDMKLYTVNVTNIALFVNLVLGKSFSIFCMLFTQSQFGIIMDLLTKMHCIPLCSLQHNHWHWSWSMWTGVTAIGILYYVYGGSCSCSFMEGDWSDTATGRAYCSWGIRTFFHLPQCSGTVLNVNDHSRMDMENLTCFICQADYPSGNIVRSDPLCVDVAGTLILDLSVIVYNSTKMVVVGSRKRLFYSEPLYIYIYIHTSKYLVKLFVLVVRSFFGTVICFSHSLAC